MAFSRSTETADLRAALAEAQARIAVLEADRIAARRRDPLTRSRSAEAFREDAGRELAQARRSGATAALVLLELDGLRALRATLGAAAGDQAMRTLASRVEADCRGHDVLGRTGEGELALLLPAVEPEAALAVAQRIVTALDEADVEGVGPVTVSAGVAIARRGAGVDEVLAEAAEQLLTAQRAGGGRVHAAVATTVDAVPTAHQDAIVALAQALSERDKYTADHSDSVVDLSTCVAASLGLDAPGRRRIGTAALLHDIGKVAIPDAILHKPAGLNAEEWVLMREHPVIGERILRAIPGLGGVARIVRHEHERWDGGGYPDGLGGDDIPLGSRIILACDTYHAMTSDRPYRERMPHAAAVEELARCAGTQFDPAVTEALIGHLWSSGGLGG